MRNFASKHNTIALSVLRAALFTLLLSPFGLCRAQEFNITSEDMVALHADKAWEDIEPDTVHFAGHFEMRIRDMLLTADRATVYGKLDNPDRLIMEGSPTRLSVTHSQGDRLEPVHAEAREIVFERESGLMRLSGGARLAQGDNILFSERIDYDIKSDRFHTEGQTDVHINVHPQE